jgi:hypothetical protein
MYVRKKGRYYYLVEGMRTPEGKTRQRVLQYQGDYQQAVQAVRKRKDRETHLARLQTLEGVLDSDCWQTPDTQEQPVLSLVAAVFDQGIGLDPTADEGADFDSVFLYFGPNVGKFVEVFRPYAASINAPL